MKRNFNVVLDMCPVLKTTRKQEDSFGKLTAHVKPKTGIPKSDLQ
jgi:hypothetical protein